MNNQFDINYDFPGLCANCHHEIADFNGSNKYGTPIITKLKATFETMQVELSDGSNMTVTVCKDCKEGLRTEDMGDLMESLIEGLIVEINRKPDLEERKQKAIDAISSKFIIQRVDKKFTSDELTRITKPKKKLKRRHSIGTDN